MGAKMRIEMGEAVSSGGVLRGGRVELSQFGGEHLQLFLHVAQFGENGKALGKDGASAEGQAFLGKVADGHTAGALQGPIIERFSAG